MYEKFSLKNSKKLLKNNLKVFTYSLNKYFFKKKKRLAQTDYDEE